MFDSVKYNLTNPAFTEDIGEANMDRMLPMSPATFDGSGMYFPGISGTMSGITLRGKLQKDTVDLEPQKEKDKRVWKNIFKVAAVVTSGVLLWKYRKGIGTKIKNTFKNMWTKIKSIFKKP